MSQLSIFRIKAGIKNPNEIIAGDQPLWSKDVRLGGSLLGILYVARSHPKPPRWLEYFESTVDFSEVNLITASSAAVLLIPRAHRLFAVVFGYGRYLLNDEAIEPRFGLRVVLNAIEPTLLRSIDHKRLEGVPRHTREQLTKDSGLDQFGLDVERDLLRAVTGTPKDHSLGIRLSGAEQLVVAGDVPLSKLGAQLDRYSALAERDDYKQNFSWVDNIAEVTDPALRTRLDGALAQDIVNATTLFWLAVPDVVDWDAIAGFRYDRNKGASTHLDLDLSQYLVERRSRREVTPETLRQEHVRCIRTEDGSDYQAWSVYRCLVGELEVEGRRFVLSEGKWYQIDPTFLAAIEREAANMLPTTVVLPRCNQKREADYNRRAARRSGGDLVLLDQDFIQYGSRGKVEVCDLYSRSKIFLHVKHAGASSVLSHLFSQGLVSATLMLNEIAFRTALRDKLPESHRWGDPNLPLSSSEFEIAYVVIARPGKKLELPFFSKINLRNAARMLKAFGFRVTLTSVPSTQATRIQE